MRGHHHPAGDHVGDLRAVVEAHEVEAEVDGRGGAGRGEHLTVADVEDAGVQVDRRVLPGQLGRIHPVRRGAPAVEQAGGGQHEGARAERRQPATAAIDGT